LPKTKTSYKCNKFNIRQVPKKPWLPAKRERPWGANPKRAFKGFALENPFIINFAAKKGHTDFSA